MAEFLQLVGAIVLAIILTLIVAVFVGYFWIRWKFKGLADSLSEKFSEAVDEITANLQAGGVPPLRIQLLRLEGHGWNDDQKMQEWCAGLKSANFEEIGDFEVVPAMMELKALLHQESNTYAVLYEHPLVGAWFDLYSMTEDGKTSFTMSTDQKSQMDRRPEHPLVRITQLTTPAKAFQKFLEERPQEQWVEVTRGEFSKRFEKAYAESMDWHVNRGGPTEEEIKRIAQQDGTEVTPQMVESIQHAWMNQAAYIYEEEMEKNYLKKSGLSASEWDEIQDRVVFIHELTSASQMLEHLYQFDFDEGETDWQSGDYEEQMKIVKEICKAHRGDTAFQKILKRFEIDNHFQQHGTVEEPTSGVVYLGPAFN